MKKGIIALVVIVALGVAGFFGYRQYAQNRVVEEVKAALQNLAPGVEFKPAGIYFEPSSNTLRLTDVAFSYGNDAINIKGTIKELRGEGASEKALNPAPGQVPLLIEALIMEGVKTELKMKDIMAASYTFASISNKGVYMNMPAILETWKQASAGGSYEPFMDELLKIRLDSSESLDYQATISMKGQPEMKQTCRRSSSSMKDGKVQLQMEDYVAIAGKDSVTMKSMSMRDMAQPSAKLLAGVFNIMRYGADDSKLDSPEANAEAMEVIRLAMEQYSTTPIYTAMTISGMDFKGEDVDGSPLQLSIAELENTLNVNPVKFGLKVKGAKGLPDPELVELNALYDLPLDTVSVDTSLDFEFHPTPDVTTLSFSLGSPELGTLDTHTGMVLPVASFTDLFSPQNRMQLMGSTLSSLEANYVDKGLTALLMASLARDEDMTFAEIHTLVQETLDGLAMQAEEEGKQVVVLLARKGVEFVNNPGTFKASFKPARPMNVFELMLDDSYLNDPAKSGISVEVTPGKALAEPKAAAK